MQKEMQAQKFQKKSNHKQPTQKKDHHRPRGKAAGAAAPNEQAKPKRDPKKPWDEALKQVSGSTALAPRPPAALEQGKRVSHLFSPGG